MCNGTANNRAVNTEQPQGGLKQDHPGARVYLVSYRLHGALVAYLMGNTSPSAPSMSHAWLACP